MAATTRKKVVRAQKVGIFDSLLGRINAIPDDQVECENEVLQPGSIPVAELSLSERKFYKLLSTLGDEARQFQASIKEKVAAHQRVHANPGYEGEDCERSHQEVKRDTEEFGLKVEELDAYKDIFWASLRLKYPGHEHLRIEGGRFLVEPEKTEKDRMQELFGGAGEGLGGLRDLLKLAKASLGN